MHVAKFFVTFHNRPNNRPKKYNIQTKQKSHNLYNVSDCEHILSEHTSKIMRSSLGNTQYNKIKQNNVSVQSI